jgi:uncharacterized protein YxeA
MKYVLIGVGIVILAITGHFFYYNHVDISATVITKEDYNASKQYEGKTYLINESFTFTSSYSEDIYARAGAAFVIDEIDHRLEGDYVPILYRCKCKHDNARAYVPLGLLFKMEHMGKLTETKKIADHAEI